VILKTSAIRRSGDNITVVFIAFENFYRELEKADGNATGFEHVEIELSMIDII
jgi:hypothetical protein